MLNHRVGRVVAETGRGEPNLRETGVEAGGSQVEGQSGLGSKILSQKKKKRKKRK
jgi:hypothetical protein